VPRRFPSLRREFPYYAFAMPASNMDVSKEEPSRSRNGIPQSATYINSDNDENENAKENNDNDTETNKEGNGRRRKKPKNPRMLEDLPLELELWSDKIHARPLTKSASTRNERMHHLAKKRIRKKRTLQVVLLAPSHASRTMFQCLSPLVPCDSPVFRRPPGYHWQRSRGR